MLFKRVDEIPIILVGTKLDRCFDKQEIDLYYGNREPIAYTWGRELAAQFKMECYVETSAMV